MRPRALLAALAATTLATASDSGGFDADGAEMLLALHGLPRAGMHSRGHDVAQLVVTAQTKSADWIMLDGHGSVWQPGKPCSSADGPGCLATARYFRNRQRERLPLARPPPAVDVSSAVEMVRFQGNFRQLFGDVSVVMLISGEKMSGRGHDERVQ